MEKGYYICISPEGDDPSYAYDERYDSYQEAKSHIREEARHEIEIQIEEYGSVDWDCEIHIMKIDNEGEDDFYYVGKLRKYKRKSDPED